MFHFKKFSIDDSKSAMKIGTDAVLLGAWVPLEDESRILDIGTGTGILALMMAQRNKKALIDAVELDSQAAILATENARLSPWAERIRIFNSSIQDFSLKNQHTYSLIICNPPFFKDSLKSPQKTRNLARHDDTLPVNELLPIASELLSKNGRAAFILPAEAFENWKNTAKECSIYPSAITWVKSTSEHKPHRVMVVFTTEDQAFVTENDMCIYASHNKYSLEYIELTDSFYLKF